MYAREGQLFSLRLRADTQTMFNKQTDHNQEDRNQNVSCSHYCHCSDSAPLLPWGNADQALLSLFTSAS